jgi:hypothetical protein
VIKLKTLHRKILLLIVTVIPGVYLHSQITTISRDWRFKTGDSLEWASPDYNDSQWNKMKAGLWWAHAGYDYSGYAWYRKKIYISSAMKSAVKNKGYLKLSLGQIQDVDQTFLNGKLIGQTGSFTPFDGRWGEPRNYLVKDNQILWDAENTIAVRVYGPNNNGGMHTGPYYFEPYRITVKDYVTMVDSYIGIVKINELDKIKFTIRFHNAGITDYKGELLFLLSNTSKTILQTSKQTITIYSNPDSSNVFSFITDKPQDDICRITAVFKEAKTRDLLTKELTFSTLKEISIPVLPQPQVVIENEIKDKYLPAPFGNQEIGGYLGNRLDINLNKRLLEVDETELLAGYLNRPGRQNWVGEHIGKYLDAACNTWLYTHDERLKVQMDRMLTILLSTQKDDGYFGTYTPEQYWTNWDVWSHKYNLAGLLSYYKSTGYLPALNAAKRIGNLLYRTFGDNLGQIDIITSGTHVGMASTSVLGPIVDLYRYTGDKKYLDFAHYIVTSYNHPDGPAIIRSVLENGHINQVANGKAYELLSNLVGILKLYKLTGEKELLTVVDIAWNDIVKNRLYITGTASSYELFRGDNELPAGSDDHMGEGCVTTTWFQLNYELFSLTSDTKYYDELEKSLYNHLLGSENPRSGCVSYYTPLQGSKPYSCGISCCLSSIPRGISMMPMINYGKIAGVPTILLFDSQKIMDTLISQSNQKIPIKIKAESCFPDSGNIVYTIIPESEAVFAINFRVPAWTNHFIALVGNETYEGIPGTYLRIERNWIPGEKVFLRFSIPIVIIPGEKSYPDRFALKRGPQVLSVDQTLNQNTNIDSLIINVPESKRSFLQNAQQILPENWIGNQAYSLEIKSQSDRIKKVFMVPFSDAGQTGAYSIVWLKNAK